MHYRPLSLILLHSSRAVLFALLTTRIYGKTAIPWLETLVVGDIEGLKMGQARLSCFTNPKGGIEDDTIITKREDHMFMIVNAGECVRLGFCVCVFCPPVLHALACVCVGHGLGLGRCASLS